MATEQQLEVLNELRANAKTMLNYYGEAVVKRLQNAALLAAGLKPLHTEHSLQWDATQADKHARHIVVLDQMISDLGGEAQAEAA